MTPHERDAYERELRALDARLHPDRTAEQAAKAIRADAAFMLSAVIVGLVLVVQGLFFSPVVAQVRLRFLAPTTPAAEGQNPIATARHADTVWAAAGVEGGIPTTRTRCTTGTGTSLLGSSSTAAQINTAITGCDANHYVELGSGTFSLSTGITFHNSSITLKGQGADSTKLVFSNGVAGCNYFDDGAISMCTGDLLYGATGNFDHSTAWTAGYAQGTSVITLTTPTGISVGSTIFLDQLDDASDGYPATGDIFVCQDDVAVGFSCSNQGGGGNAGRSGRAQVSMHQVTAVVGSSITIDPPIYFPNIRSGQTPQAWWNDFSNASWLHDSGIEDLSIDISSIGSGIAGVAMHGTRNCWIKGVRSITNDTTGGSELFHVLMINGFHNTIRDSYLYGPDGPDGNQRYSISLIMASQNLIENNILDHTTSAVVPNGPTFGNVISFNFVKDATMTSGGTVAHGFTMMNLHEGNNMSGILLDIIHAPHYFETIYRNLLDRDASNPTINVDTPIALQANARFVNVVGNVMGDGSATSYETTSADCGGCIFKLGWQGNDSFTGTARVNNDTRVKATLFRWGNWDTETAAVRWCGKSSNTGWVANCASTSEVPTTITNYPNTVPATETLPNSLYLSAKPSFFGATTYPPIGPEAACTTIAGVTCPSNAGLHAFKIPARIAYEAMADDPAYAGTTVRIFKASDHYPVP